MSTLQDQYDDAMFDFSTGNYYSAISKFMTILAEDPGHFEAQLALGMAHYRRGDYATAIVEGLKAERLKPHEQLVHTNLSLFYMKAGDKATAEHHGLQARIASWRTDAQQAKEAQPAGSADPDLQMAKPKLEPLKLPGKFPEMPWKKKPPGNEGHKS
jgi:Flp pilus assembly protein TadD